MSGVRLSGLVAVALALASCDGVAVPLPFPFDVETETFSATLRCDPEVPSTVGGIVLENEGPWFDAPLRARYRGTPTLVARESPTDALFDVLPAPGAGTDPLRFRLYGATADLDGLEGREVNVVVDTYRQGISLACFVSFADDDGAPLFMAYSGDHDDLQLADCAPPWFCPRLRLQDTTCATEDEHCGRVRHVSVRYDLAFARFELTPGSDLRYDDGLRSFRLVLHDAYRRGETTCTDLGSSRISTYLLSDERPAR